MSAEREGMAKSHFRRWGGNNQWTYFRMWRHQGRRWRGFAEFDFCREKRHETCQKLMQHHVSVPFSVVASKLNLKIKGSRTKRIAGLPWKKFLNILMKNCTSTTTTPLNHTLLIFAGIKNEQVTVNLEKNPTNIYVDWNISRYCIFSRKYG